MNERIQKWLENHLVRCEYTEFGWQECHRYEFDETELKEFTQLIVRECAEAVKNSIWHLPRGYKVADQAEFIKKHFGVE